MKDIGIIGSADGPTSIYVSSKSEDFWKSGGIVEENDDVQSIDEVEQDSNELEDMENKLNSQIEPVIEDDINARLDSKTLGENLDSGFKIMGLGMLAVFGVLTILYIIIKIMGQFAKQKKDKENSDETN